jgi:hypothetical protein
MTRPPRQALGAVTALALLAAAPTPAERAACAGDAVRFCMAHISSRANMIACLQAHRAELSPACQAVIRARR